MKEKTKLLSATLIALASKMRATIRGESWPPATWTASSPLFLASQPALALAWTPVIQLATATIGVVTVALYSLTFFPPRAYQRWVAGAARPTQQG